MSLHKTGTANFSWEFPSYGLTDLIAPLFLIFLHHYVIIFFIVITATIIIHLAVLPKTQYRSQFLVHSISFHHVCCCTLSFICDSFNFSLSVSHRSRKWLLCTEVPWAMTQLCLLQTLWGLHISAPIINASLLIWAEVRSLYIMRQTFCSFPPSWLTSTKLTGVFLFCFVLFLKFGLFSATICLPTV